MASYNFHGGPRNRWEIIYVLKRDETKILLSIEADHWDILNNTQPTQNDLEQIHKSYREVLTWWLKENEGLKYFTLDLVSPAIYENGLCKKNPEYLATLTTVKQIQEGVEKEFATEFEVANTTAEIIAVFKKSRIDLNI